MKERSDIVQKSPYTAAVLFLFLLAALVFPAAAVEFSATQYAGNVPAGGTINYAILAGVPWEGEPVDLLVEVMGINQKPDLQFVAVDPVKDVYSYSARKYTSIVNNTVHLDKGSKKQIILSFQLPADIGDGGRYAMVVIRTLPGKNVTASDYNIPVFLTILGSTPTLSGSITALDAVNGTAGQPVTITTSYTNTGNIHQDIVNKVTIMGSDGTVIITNTTLPQSNPLLPGKTYTFSITPETRDLPAGTYTVTSRVSAGKDETMDRKTVMLTIAPSASPGIQKTTPAVTTLVSTVPAATKSPVSPFPVLAAMGSAIALISVWKRDR